MSWKYEEISMWSFAYNYYYLFIIIIINLFINRYWQFSIERIEP